MPKIAIPGQSIKLSGMRKPTPKQISLKTTWSPDDEVELFEVLSRVSKHHAKATMLIRRANAISPGHPHAAIELLDRCLTAFPEILPYQQREAAKALGAVSVQIGAPELGADRLLAYSKYRLAESDKGPDGMRDYLLFVAENSVESHYQNAIDTLALVEHDHPRPDLPRVNSLPASWILLCGCAYFAHCLKNEPLSEELLEQAEALQVHDNRAAPEPWRLWLFKKKHMGSRRVTFILVRPDFSLTEMQDWAKKNWTKFRPEVTYFKIDEDERLILIWDEFAVDIVLHGSRKRARAFTSYFKKKNLGKFQTEDAQALSWRDAGDVDHIDAINTSIELLDYFRSDPRIVVNIG